MARLIRVSRSFLVLVLMVVDELALPLSALIRLLV